MKLVLNKQKFLDLQGNMTDVKMADLLHMNRTQLWRIKNNLANVGEKFIAGFKQAFPRENTDEFFLLKTLQQSDTSIQSKPSS